jgi:outer membrane protein OmpA-like peptidoglycan-associated protein/tetratricopeptide (TPR) repeat protein
MKHLYTKFVSRPLLLTLMLVFITTTIHAQLLTEYRADRKFSQFAYVDAIELYGRLVKRGDSSKHVVQRLADAYRLVDDFKNAKTWYDYLVTVKQDSTPRNLYYYAEMLKANGKYTESVKWMDKYGDYRPDDLRTQVGVTTEPIVAELLKDSTRYILNLLEMNSPYGEFGPMYYKNALVFSSSRPETVEPIKHRYPWNELPYFDLYYGEILDNGDLDTITIFAEKINTIYHEGPVGFSDDDDVMFFTRNNYTNKKMTRDQEKINYLQIYEAEFKSGEWEELLPLPFNADTFSTGHPSLTPDGKRMYFASDRPGGYGGTDIYYVDRDSSGNWTEPVNCGRNVNTEGEEMFPFIHESGTLFFASDGFAGLGGLDLFMAEPAGHDFASPVNLGYPVNTNMDDFSLIINKQMMKGYLSSNRESGTGDDDIYYFEILNKGPKPQLDSISIFWTEKEVPVDALANDSDPDGDDLLIKHFTDVSKKGGKVCMKDNKFFYTPPEGYIGIDEVYYTICDDVKLGSLCEDTTIIINVMEADYTLIAKVSDKETKQPIREADIILTNLNSGRKTDLVSNKQGTVKYPIEPKTDYMLSFEKETYFTKTARTTTKGVEPGIVRVEEMLLRAELDKTFKLENLYYDLDKWNIRPDAALVLDEVVKLMKENPTLKIELSSHTDCRASWSYNQRLSQRRAESAVRYIVNRGIDADRIVAKGYGETMLVNECKDGVPCSEEKHQNNRRTEVTILEF